MNQRRLKLSLVQYSSDDTYSYPSIFYFQYNQYLIAMQATPSQTSFKQAYTLELRQKMVENLNKKSKQCVLVIIEKDEKCVKYPHLTSSMFMIGRDKTRISIEAELRKRLGDLMNRSLENQSLFMYTAKKILNSDDKFGTIYEKHKDVQDGILYLKYSSIEPF